MKSNCSKRIVKLDLYREPINLRLPGGDAYYGTITGSILGITTVFLVSFYAMYKLLALVNFNDYKIQVRQDVEYFNYTDAFGASNGFAIAVGISAFDGDGTPIEDPSIGEVKFYAKRWGGPNLDNLFTELETRPCSFKEDL